MEMASDALPSERSLAASLYLLLVFLLRNLTVRASQFSQSIILLSAEISASIDVIDNGAPIWYQRCSGTN